VGSRVRRVNPIVDKQRISLTYTNTGLAERNRKVAGVFPAV
jgi:hypothetical protein